MPKGRHDSLPVKGRSGGDDDDDDDDDGGDDVICLPNIIKSS